jgi:hypothetical protein
LEEIAVIRSVIRMLGCAIVLACAFPQGGVAQEDIFQIPQPAASELRFICTYIGSVPPKLSFSDLQPPSLSAQRLINEMYRLAGVRRAPQVYASDKVPNAAAANIGKQRAIIYNPNFMKDLLNRAGNNRWSIISVLAHELGHHMYGHPIEGEFSTPPKELEADNESGWIMRRLGATLDDAQVAMKIVATEQATSTHPARLERLKAIQEGYDDKTPHETEKPKDDDPFPSRLPNPGQDPGPARDTDPNRIPNRTPIPTPVPSDNRPFPVDPNRPAGGDHPPAQPPSRIPCQHPMPCQHRLPCNHPVSCSHRVPCQHPAPFGGLLHQFDLLHPADAAHQFDVMHMADRMHEFDTTSPTPEWSPFGNPLNPPNIDSLLVF